MRLYVENVFFFYFCGSKWWSKQKLKCESHCSKFKHGKADFMSLLWHEWLFYHLEAFAHFIIHTFFFLVFCRRKFWQKCPVLLSIQHLKCEMDEIRCNWNTFDLQILVVHWIHLTPALPCPPSLTWHNPFSPVWLFPVRVLWLRQPNVKMCT